MNNTRGDVTAKTVEKKSLTQHFCIQILQYRQHISDFVSADESIEVVTREIIYFYYLDKKISGSKYRQNIIFHLSYY